MTPARLHTMFRGPSLFVVLSLSVTLGLGALLSACTESDNPGSGSGDAVFIDNPPADSVVFWPPSMKYARRGDTIYTHIRGLKRQAMCAVPQEVRWNFRRDTTGSEFYRARSSFEIPARTNCAADSTGFDTLFRVRFYTRVGNNLYLETPDGVVTDSLQFIAEDAPALVSAGQIRHGPSGADSTVSGRFTYFDSTETNPERRLRIDSLATCEVVQTAVFEMRQDTTLVKFRLIRATPRPAGQFPPCGGPRRDSITVVFNRFNFLP
jgi:hypothetical protein